METNATQQSVLQNTRVSRYLSVRKAAAREEEKAPPLPEVPQSFDINKHDKGPISRQPSRYRRPGAPRNHDVPLPTNTNGALPTRSHATAVVSRTQPIPEPTASAESTHSAPEAVQDVGNKAQLSPQPAERTPRSADTSLSSVKRMTRYRSRTTSAPKQDNSLSPRRSYDRAREEARLILEGEYDRLHRLKLQQEQAEGERRQRAEAKLVKQQAQQVENEGVATEAATSSQGEEQEQRPTRSRKWTIGNTENHTSPPLSTSQSTPSSQKLQLVQEAESRKPSQDDRRPQTSNTPVQSPASSAKRSEEHPSLKQRVRRRTHSQPREAQSPRTFEPKAGDGPPKTAVNGPAQTVDAPVSAVNAGERRVEIRFGKSKITLPVTPSTTVKDLLNSASIIMSQPIDPRTSVLVETYYPLGLERPLRRYEHIRDVMNSWDSDTQNYLMIMPQAECAATGLEHKDAPEEQPQRTMLNLYHSQKPGKWEKHWMILKDDGQVTASTKENDGNAANVFHLSDFDVYMPTKKQMKKLRPPKKICFAIKSQQRSIMFESTENFVHFFATNDKAVADQWYNCVQAWRSWYLVNVLGEGTITKLAAEPTAKVTVPTHQTVVPRPSTSHSRDSIPYQLGTFQPLLDFNINAIVYGEQQQQLQPSERRAVSSPQRSKTLVDHVRNKSITDPGVSSLERRTTRKRPSTSSQNKHHREESQHVPVAPSSTDAAFTGKGLLARAFSVKKSQAEENVAHFENPDNAFTGKGLLSRKLSINKFAHENSNPGVVENTKDAFTGAGLLSLQRKMSTSTKRPVPENLNPAVVVENTNDAFTGAGLLSVQRNLTKKRSASSARPGKPLVSLAANSEYSDGSLLRRVEGLERATGQNMPLVDRSRGVEIITKTGEV